MENNTAANIFTQEVDGRSYQIIGKLYREDIGDSAVTIRSNYGGNAIINTSQLYTMELDEKHVIKQELVEYATELVRMYSPTIPSIANDILFVVDEKWQPSEKANDNSLVRVDIVKANFWVQHLLGKRFIVKLKKHYLEQWTDAQVVAAIFSQMMRVNQDDLNVRKYSEDFGSRMIATFGAGYLEPDVNIPNMLKETVNIANFKCASGQLSIDDLAPVDEQEAE